MLCCGDFPSSFFFFALTLVPLIIIFFSLGKYVGNRPIKLRKSAWKDRNLDVKAKKERERFGPYPKVK